MPSQGKDLNKGVYVTPRAFLKAVNTVWPIGWDLACDETNNALVAIHGVVFRMDGFTERDNALAMVWNQTTDWNWANPPYSDIEPWVKKAYEESLLGAKIVMLLPQSHDANWARDWVTGKCLCLDVMGRLKFSGAKTAYPKGLMLCVYAKGLVGRGEFEWRD